MPGSALESWTSVGMLSARAAARTGTLTYPPIPATARALCLRSRRLASRNPVGSRDSDRSLPESLLPANPEARTVASAKPASGTSRSSSPPGVPTNRIGASGRRARISLASAIPG
jgi:hypothetical protein